MKLRIKIPLLFLIVIITFIAIIHLILTTVVLKSYVDLEDQEASKISQRLQQSVQNRLATLDSKSSDWANWDDAYQFIEDKNPEFIRSNIQNNTFTSLKINLMIFYNATGSVVFSKNYDISAGKALAIPTFFLNQDQTKFFTSANFLQTNWVCLTQTVK